MSLNYSKWDHIGSDSENDDNDNDSDGDMEHDYGNVGSSQNQNQKRFQPTVTTLNRGEQVKLSPQGFQILPSSTAAAKTATTTTTTPTSSTTAEAKSGSATASSLWRNGGKCSSFHWTQTKNDVVVRFPLAANTLARNITIKVLKKEGGGSLQAFQQRQLQIQERNGNNFAFVGDFHNDVDLKDNIDKDTKEFSDWELLTIEGQKYLVVTLSKKSPIANAVFWWDRVFQADECIDVTQIEDRQQQQQQQQQATKGKESTASVWKEAHEMFLKKINSNKEEEGQQE